MIYTLKVQSVYDDWSKAEKEIFQEHVLIIWICVVCQYMEVRGLNCDVLHKRYLRNSICLEKKKCITQLLLYFYPNTVASRCSQSYAHSGAAFTLLSKVLEYALGTVKTGIKTTLSVGLECMSFVLLLLLQHIGLRPLSASNKHVISETGSWQCPPWCWLMY